MLIFYVLFNTYIAHTYVINKLHLLKIIWGEKALNDKKIKKIVESKGHKTQSSN